MRKLFVGVGAATVLSLASVVSGCAPVHAAGTVYKCTKTVGTRTAVTYASNPSSVQLLESRGYSCTQVYPR